MAVTRWRLEIRGIVQGVGFRPFVYRLAMDLNLSGWVRNSSEGALIEIEGNIEALENFWMRLNEEKPPYARISECIRLEIAPKATVSFEIEASLPGKKSAGVLPDLATCASCLAEIFDPKDRRYRYPFGNCTQCGPRFSIIEALPYDRVHTTMKAFPMCAACRQEYEDPLDRRFHAQPIACPKCGPQLEYWDIYGNALASGDAALAMAIDCVSRQEILAVKSLGGFHLFVDARNVGSIGRLRQRKSRPAKPFAMMFPSLEEIQRVAELSPLESSLLLSPEAPIVLLRKLPKAKLPDLLAPGNPYCGAMLPYTPLHHLLMKSWGFPVVATSGNRSEEPICRDEKEAVRRLEGIADGFLVHNRPIARPVDDSILRVMAGREMILRRARGFAPMPIPLKGTKTVLALGSQLKNTVALKVAQEVMLSQHIGDLETPQAMEVFDEAVSLVQEFYEIKPDIVACDLHPDYASTRFAEKMGLPLLRIQHHHAHVAACMAEHGLTGSVLGVAWDGSGLGLNGQWWGGEFFHVSAKRMERVAHILPFPLPGGERAIREPRRSALGLLYKTFGDELFADHSVVIRKAFSDSEWNILRHILQNGLYSPSSSAVGRLFDAVAALIGMRYQNEFEAQAALELEFCCEAGDDAGAYTLEFFSDASKIVLDWRPMIRDMIEDLREGRSQSSLARDFHLALAHGLLNIAHRVGERRVVLSGGCFQNKFLLEISVSLLRKSGFDPIWPQKVPPNDGSISLGQIALATARE